MMFRIHYWAFIYYFLMNSAIPAFSQLSNGFAGALLLESTFETDKRFSNWAMEVCRPDAITLTKAVSRKGKFSARFEFCKTDPLTYNRFVRAELKQHFPTDTTGELWYGFSNFFPSDYFSDPMPEVVAQWHEIPDWDLGEDWRSPPISMEIKNDRYYVKVMWASASVNTNKTKDGEIYYDLGLVDKDTWNDWVFHIKFRYDSTGFLEVWKNKTKVLTRNGPNSYNDKRFPYFKLGIYKWGWASGGINATGSKRILYVDEVRVGNRHSSLDEVSPQ